MKIRFLFPVMLCVMLAACAPKTRVVLLPDPDGNVGRLEVTNQGGTRVVDQANHSVEVSSAEIRPQAPKAMSRETIDSVFGKALAAEPLPPARFLLYFEKGTSLLTAQSKALMEKVYEAIHERASLDVSIVGHTDRVGSEEDNKRLSLDRARSIGELLKSAGVASENIEITSHGENNPLIETADGVDEPRNRRVEILVR